MNATAKVPKVHQYNLNSGQQAAADAFFEFLFSPDKEFIIAGAAGVGKTYLMNYIIDNALPRYFEMCQMMGMKPEYDDVVMTATTNKAAEVLSQAVNRPTSTVHSFFNLVVRDDYRTGKTILKQSRSWIVHTRKVIFVDEASMIDVDLWKMLMEGTHNCKLVYVGDHNQLAPVQEDLSTIYKHKSPFVELTQPVRNAGQPALMEVCQQLRETVATGEFRPIQIRPGVIDLLNGQEMQDTIQEHFHAQTHAARILAYTNKRVLQYNDHIREIRTLPATLQPGELMVSNSVYHSNKGIIPVEAELTIIDNKQGGRLRPDEEDDEVYLEVDYLTVQDAFGERYHEVPFATDREHFNALLKWYAGQKRWGPYFNMKNNIADLRPRDAATVHKSQGSTYDTVFIDLGNISTCHIQNQVARMLYVAFSRARSRVYLYGDLAEKYGGVILP